MRIKKDYMGNDQLLPAYNVQIGVADEYIVVLDVNQYRSDMDCFIPLMEKFHKIYGYYPEYPVADAGYGSFNNYLYCKEHGMNAHMKFAMFHKTLHDKKYRTNPFRAVNFETAVLMESTSVSVIKRTLKETAMGVKRKYMNARIAAIALMQHYVRNPLATEG